MRLLTPALGDENPHICCEFGGGVSSIIPGEKIWALNLDSTEISLKSILHFIKRAYVEEGTFRNANLKKDSEVL